MRLVSVLYKSTDGRVRGMTTILVNTDSPVAAEQKTKQYILTNYPPQFKYTICTNDWIQINAYIDK